jgi:hypothetical protein
MSLGGFKAETLHSLLQAYVPGFAVEQITTPMGKVTITLHHTFEMTYTPMADPHDFFREVISRIDSLILATRSVENLREEMRKKDAQITALTTQMAQLQSYANYVEVAKEIAKAGAK